MPNFIRLDDNFSEIKEGYYSLSLGSVSDYFDIENGFGLEGYLFYPKNPKTLLVFQTDIMATGDNGYALEFAKALYSRNIAVLTFDNSGSGNFEGKSTGTVRDYMPEQMGQDLVQVFNFLEGNTMLSNLKRVLSGVSYGCVPIISTLSRTFYSIDGLVFIGSPENGAQLFEKYYKQRFKEGRAEDNTEIYIYSSKSTNKMKTIPKLFFGKKMRLVNLLNIPGYINENAIQLDIPVKFVCAGNDEIIGKINKISGLDYFYIEGAQHNFLNKWSEMIDEVEKLCKDVESN